MADILAKVAEDSARGGFFLISGTVVSTVIMAISSILIGRLLGPEPYGQYTLALVIPQLFYLLTDLGINQGVTKFIATFNTRKETDRIIKVLKYSILLKALVGVGLFTLNYALAETLAQLFLQRTDLTPFLQIASFSILFQAIFTIATSAFVGLDKTEYSALTSNVQAIAKTIISIILVLLGLGVAGAIIGYTLSYGAAAGAGILIIALILRGKKTTKSHRDTQNDLASLVRYGAPLYLSILLTGFTPLFKNFVLANYTTDADIGNYKAALNFATLITTLSIPITTALLPAFSKIDSEATSKIRQFFKHANKYTTLLILPMTVLLMVYSTQAVHIIYGSTYQSASLFLATYCLLYFMVGIGYLTLTSMYNGLGETKTTFTMSLITFSILATLSPTVTAHYGVQGLIGTFLLASLVGTIYGLVKAKRKFTIKFEYQSLAKIYAVSIVSAAPSILITHLASPPELINLVAGATLYLAIYITLTPLTKIITLSELESIKKTTEKIRPLRLTTRPILNYQQKILKRRTKNAQQQS